MKRLSPVLCLFLFLFLCSCSLTAKVPERITEFSSDVKITCGGKEFAGTLECLSYCSIKFTFSYPDRLNGISVRTDENGFFCDIYGVTDKLPTALLNADSCAVRLFEALQNAVFSPLELRKNTAGDYTAQLLNGKYTSVYRSDGSVRLIYANDGFTVEFI